MLDRTIRIDDRPVPRIVYGTAWKEHSTQALVELALAQGFRGIDTANQRRHYYEAAVGAGVARAIERGLVTRDALFLQTKYTFLAGQDHRLPYDPAAPIAEQVAQSIASSLEHLQVDAIDSYVLHGPTRRVGLGHDDWEAWRAMEAAHDARQTRWLGVSNVTLAQLRMLCGEARMAPRFVQNRCFAAQGWDREVRRFCESQGIIYQGFSLLTANHEHLNDARVIDIARHHQRTPAEIIFRFALEVGMQPLTGTTNPAHMQADLSVFDFELDKREVAMIETIAED